MKTPTLFSAPVMESLLPEVAGAGYHRKASALAAASGHRCEATKYPYPPLNRAPGQTFDRTFLMLEPRETAANGQPLTGAQIHQRLRKPGLTAETVRLICPLVFWSRHVDLAVDYGKGDIVFAPWISQGEMITLFRTLQVAAAQPESDRDSPVIQFAAEAYSEMASFLANEDLLKGLLALPESAEWDAKLWIETVRGLPSRERRVYMQRFGQHIRFMPSWSAFADMGSYWKETAHSSGQSSDATDAGNAWIRRFQVHQEAIEQQMSR